MPKGIVNVIMGSQSDYATMSHAVKILEELNISHEVKIISAHRTPERLYEYAKSSDENGVQVIIAGGAAHLPGMVASLTKIPVLGVPVESKSLKGMDSLLSIVQMPGGVPVATFAIGDSGAKNAAIFAAGIIALENSDIAQKLVEFRKKQTDSVAKEPVV